MMTPTLLDVVAIIGLSTDRNELPSLFALLGENLGIHFSKFRVFYLAFLIANAKSRGNVSNAEHHVFLLY